MYLDTFASAAAIAEPAREQMRALAEKALGNPSSAHTEGRLARKVLREARAEVAQALGADPDEVIFTSGVTEALAMAARGLLQRSGPVACSKYEHAALYEALIATGRPLKPFAYDEPVPEAAIVAFALVNHETGMLAPFDRLCATEAAILVDAAQATGRARAAWAEPRVTAMALSSHKIGGPTGVGALLLRKGRPFVPLVKGGPQEHELRAGTEAVIATAGFARALSTYVADAGRDERLAALTTRFETALATLRAVKVVAADRPRAPGVTAAYAIGVPARAVLEDLDARGVQIASGAACAAHTNAPSNVLLNLGLSRERATEVFRVSFAGHESAADVDRLVLLLKEVIDKRRGEVADGGA